ncbi:MAG TPA: ATP-binding protein [Gaiellaceae bacterium]|nr:ATP-binding protein [Gaiellaceae bacterium]
MRALAAWNMWYRVAGSLAAVALVTAAIELAKPWVPVLSLGVLYILAVLPVAIAFGLAYAVFVAVGSMLAFNFFFLPPLYTLTLADSRNWFALVVFLVTAVVVSELAALLRRRADESSLLAQVATSLLERGDVTAELDSIAAEAARVLRVRSARITLGSGAPEAGEVGEPLVAGDRRVGTIFVPVDEQRPTGRRLLRALATLLAVAIDRERLAREAYDAETLRRSDAVKTAVIQAVSHDLRTPLATIETALGSLRSGSLLLTEQDRGELLEAIAVELDRLKRLVENLLDLSRLQAGAAEPVPEVWTPEQLLADALDELERAERVEVVVAADLPLVRVDGGQIQRVLVNLLENALKFSEAPSPVQVRANPSRGEVVLRVTNRGPGIPQNELDRIFEPFQRGAAGSAGGAGLGLAIARGFAEANGGRIWAESRPGQGATFALALPTVERPALISA